MINQTEQAYFEGLSGHQPTDDTWWDLWIIYYEPQWGEEICHSEEVAQSELKRLSEKFPNSKYHIDHIENAGFGDLCHKMWGGRFFPNEGSNF